MKTYWYFIISFFILVSQGTAYSQNLYSPYPIIFVHGINDDDSTWTTIASFLTNGDPKDMKVFDICLNHDGNNSIAYLSNDTSTVNLGWRNGNFSSNGIYAINFDQKKFPAGSGHDKHLLGNQSAIYKQGCALGEMIKEVLYWTKASKVILVGHSMGGFAIREYLQRTEDNNRKWWVDPSDALNGHHVAKVVTIGTPHGGCDGWASLIGWKTGIDANSEAVRDLKTNLDVFYKGFYIWGGYEYKINPLLNYYNKDINCNNSENDLIYGLNEFNHNSLPTDIAYTWIVSDWIPPFPIVKMFDDGVVEINKQYLTYGDTIMTNKFHTDEPSDYYSIVRGLDEPDDPALAYEIRRDSTIKGFITYQSYNNAVDKDVFKIILSQSGFLKLTIAGYFESGVDNIELLDSDGNPLSHLEYPYFYMGISKYITSGTYYVRVSGTAKPNSYMNPYTITTNFYESESSIEGIVNLEYFLDNDPSWGKGVVLDISSSSNIVENINVPLNTVSDGFHSLFVRVKDVKDRWSIPQNIPFYRLKVTSLNISQLEYFLDTDPGLGNGNQLSVTASSDMTKNFNIPLSGIQNGFHVLYVRAKGKNGNWSICSNTAFYKTDISSTDIVKMEYCIDVDPGFGNATTVSVTKGIDISKKVNIDLSNVSEGFHTLYIRAKNASGKWSLNAINAFYCMQPQTTKITDLEYFFDMDPGFGYGTSIPVTPATSNITKLFNVDLACLSTGNHTFYVRAKNDLGNWSLIYSKNVAVSTVAPVITQNGTMLHSNATKGNQWYNQNGLINGATNQDYVVPSNGDYCVIVTHSGCSSDKSNIIKVFVSGIEQTSLNNSIKVYPNPVQNELIMEFDGSTSFEILNLMGQVIYNGILIKTAIVQTSNLSTGVYLIKFKMGKTFEYKKFIKE